MLRQAQQPMDQAAAMDRMYRWQRYIYDLTRKYYLFGRDTLIEQMAVRPGDRVLEIGCGTGRNLGLLVKRHPQARFYGLDASQQMLDSAQAKLAHQGLDERVSLAQCLAEDLDYAKTFGLEQPFDVVFFSYTLSMIPTWPQAIEAALANLRPGGRLYMVDFGDMQAMPGGFRALLKRWLALFGVHHRPELLAYMESHHPALRLRWLPGRYAFILQLDR